MKTTKTQRATETVERVRTGYDFAARVSILRDFESRVRGIERRKMRRPTSGPEFLAALHKALPSLQEDERGDEFERAIKGDAPSWQHIAERATRARTEILEALGISPAATHAEVMAAVEQRRNRMERYLGELNEIAEALDVPIIAEHSAVLAAIDSLKERANIIEADKHRTRVESAEKRVNALSVLLNQIAEALDIDDLTHEKQAALCIERIESITERLQRRLDELNEIEEALGLSCGTGRSAVLAAIEKLKAKPAPEVDAHKILTHCAGRAAKSVSAHVDPPAPSHADDWPPRHGDVWRDATGHECYIADVGGMAGTVYIDGLWREDCTLEGCTLVHRLGDTRQYIRGDAWVLVPNQWRWREDGADKPIPHSGQCGGRTVTLDDGVSSTKCRADCAVARAWLATKEGT